MIPTTILETSKLLKEAGFPQDTDKQWIYFNKHVNGAQWLLENVMPNWNKLKYAAPTTDELLAELPWRIKGDYRLQIRKFNDGVAGRQVLYMDLNGSIKHDCFNLSLPEALAQMWLWLKKEGLI